MSAHQRITYFPNATVAFAPAVYTGTKVIRQASYKETRQTWQTSEDDEPYNYKVLFTDMLSIQVHTQSLTSPTPTLAIYDHNKNVIVSLMATPYWKGIQDFPGNTYDIGGTPYALATTQWSFRFEDLAAYITEGGIYYLGFTNYYTGQPDILYFSEPIFLDDITTSPTQLYQFSFNSNKSGNTNIIVQNWFNDYPTNTIPYNPLFSVRAEGYTVPSDIQAINIGYLQQQYRQLQIKTEQVTLFKLTAGEISLGIPFYLFQALTQALLADNLWIDGTNYILFNPNGNTSLQAIWKLRSMDDIKMLFYASCILIFVSEAQNALLSPPKRIDRIFTDSFTDSFM